MKRSHLVPDLKVGKEISFPALSGSQLMQWVVEHQVWRGRSTGDAYVLLWLCHLHCQVTVKQELGPVNFGEQFSTKGERDEKPCWIGGSLELNIEFH